MWGARRSGGCGWVGKNKNKKTQGGPGGRTSRRGLGGALIIYNMLVAPPSLEMILWTFLWRRRCDVRAPLARSVATLSWVHGGSRSGARHPAWAGRTTKEEATPQASQLLTIAALGGYNQHPKCPRAATAGRPGRQTRRNDCIVGWARCRGLAGDALRLCGAVICRRLKLSEFFRSW